MKKVLTISFMFMTVLLVSSSGYSQDTTISVQSDPAEQSLVIKEKPVSKWEYSVNFTGRKVTGYTEYHIQFPTVIGVSYDGGYTYLPYPVTGHSILAFPIDGYRLEAVANCKLQLAKKKAFIFELGVASVISQPKEIMADTDYVDLSDFGMAPWVQGATRSKVDYSNYDISLNIGYPLMLGKKAHLIPKMGFQTSMNKFDVLGLAGWYSWYSPNDPYPVDSADWAGEKMGTYKVTYNRIVTGAQIKTNGEEGVIFSLQALYFPWVKATDHDNHLLRNKVSDTEASGKGYTLGGRLEIPVHTTRTGSVWLIGGGYELLRITATGSQIQSWYGDDPMTDDFDDTGSVSSPIDNTLKLRQNSFIAFFEYKL